MLLFPFSGDPENDYFIWLLHYLVSKSPTYQPVRFNMTAGQRQDSPRHAEGNVTKSLLPAELIRTLW